MESRHSRAAPNAARSRSKRSRCGTSCAAESIVDVMNGDAIVRVSDVDALALGAKIETFDEALHEVHPRRASLCK